MPTLDASTALLIPQWAGSPKMLATVDAALDPLRNDALPALERIELMRRIDTAEGVWLDWLGARYGLRRPATADPALDERFGFDDAGLGFDVAPFRGDVSNDVLYPLPDALFRRFVKARTILDFADGTPQTFTRAVLVIDPGASVRDNRDMTIRIVTTAQVLLELADSSGALPRTAGVRLLFVARDVFGFDDAGVGFDLGPFRAEG